MIFLPSPYVAVGMIAVAALVIFSVRHKRRRSPVPDEPLVLADPDGFDRTDAAVNFPDIVQLREPPEFPAAEQIKAQSPHPSHVEAEPATAANEDPPSENAPPARSLDELADLMPDIAELLASSATAGGDAPPSDHGLAEDSAARPSEKVPEEVVPPETGGTGYKDRRGQKRARRAANEISPDEKPVRTASIPVADLRLRLFIHPLAKRIGLSVVLARPDGFPLEVRLAADQPAVRYYDDSRYDDFGIEWNESLLSAGLRFKSADAHRWARSRRRLQIFADDPAGSDQISVSAAGRGRNHSIICRAEDVSRVQSVTQSCGSPVLSLHDGWKGIPAGWAVLSGYTPVHSAAETLEPDFSTLDPGHNVSIVFKGGLATGEATFTEGSVPRIGIDGFVEGLAVEIDGRRAAMRDDGGWQAEGWDLPGEHLIDVIPGPSLTYRILPDPARGEGWPFWDAWPDRFSSGNTSPWSVAGICGARIQGPHGETVIVAPSRSFMNALGARREASVLRERAGTGVSASLTQEPPSFLLCSTGPRRTQGRITVLGLGGSRVKSSGFTSRDTAWLSAVLSAASKHLPLQTAGAADRELWRQAVAAARRIKRRRRIL